MASLGILLMSSAIIFVCASVPAASLQYNHYAISCPNAESIVRSTTNSLLARDSTARSALLRLLFHDCQVNGCDASIMLDTGPDGTSELQSGANLGVRRLDFIDNIKMALEATCPATVSCADIIAMAARDAVFLSGGPDIAIPLGRLDGFQASAAAADSALPPATIPVSDMLNLFRNMGLNLQESVAILGAHTMGVAHCSNFRNRLYPVRDPNMGLLFGTLLRARCPRFFPLNSLVALDSTMFMFDTAYFNDVLNRRGLLTIDSELGLDPRTGPVVQYFAFNAAAFYDAFSAAFVKLSSFMVAGKGDGEVRLNCHVINS